MFEKQATIHFNSKDQKPIDATVQFGEGFYFGSGNRLQSVVYDGRQRKFSWNGLGDNFDDINGFIIDGEFFGRSEFTHLILEVETKIRNKSK